MGYGFAAEYNHAQERLYTCHFYAIFAGPRIVEIQKYCYLPWQRDVTTSLSIRKETCLPLVRLLRFSLNKFSVIQLNPAISKSQEKWKKVRNSGVSK